MSMGERLTSAWLRAKALLRRRQLERDLEDELRFHVAMREEQYGAAGLGEEDARRTARRRFGNLLARREECRDAWTFRPLEAFGQDVRFAGRMLWKSRGFTVVAVLSLALGIGANTAMFSLVNAILLRPLPYPQAGRLVRLTGFYPKGAVAALQEQSRTMDVAGVGTEAEVNLTGHGDAVRLTGSAVSANLFAVLGRGASLGRTFEKGDDLPGRDRLVVLSHAAWQDHFQADPAVVGRTVAVDGVAREIVGVMPAGFHFPSGSTRLWVPLRLDPTNPEDYWGFGWMPAVGRLRPEATLAVAHHELRSMIVRISGLFPWPAPTWNANGAAVSLQDDLVRDLRRKLLVLQAAVGIVLMIACANVASLLLSRAAGRRKEMALRAALGASRGRIVSQLLTESVTLSVLGGIAGVALALAALAGIGGVLPADARGFSDVRIDGGVFAFVTALSVLSGLVFGLAPAASASRVDLSASMKAGGRRGAETGGTRLRGSLIATEVALAVVLAVGAGLLMRTLWGLTRADPGFRPERTLTVSVSPDPSTCQVRSACVALYGDLLRRVSGMAGVSEVAAASALPLSRQQPLLPVELEGHPFVPGQAAVPLLWAGAVTPGYFRVLRVPVLQGRGFEDSDGEHARSVVLVSAATARRYWPGQEAVGRRVRVVWDEQWRTVVGVVGDVRQYTLSGRAPADITGALYMPYPQAVALDRQIPRTMSLFVRSGADPAEVAPRLRGLVAGVNPDVPVGDVRALESLVSSSVSEPRAMMWLFAAFAGCALLLAAVGTYGVVSYTTAQRTYEIGVRMAVGATRGQVFGLVLGHSLRLVLTGAALGVLAALALGRTLSSFLYGVTARDPVTFSAVGALLIVTAILAGYLPGRRAAATDPVRALRGD
jgi:predicted permease